MNKYFAICVIGLKNLVYYPQKLYATVLIVPFRLVVLLFIYNYAFSYIGRSIDGITANIAVWSMAVYHILLFAQFREKFRVINADIRLGNFEMQMNKPYNYLLYKFWEQLGKGLPHFFLSLLIVVPLLGFLAGFPQVEFSLPRVIGAICLVLAGTLVSALLYSLVALPALWIDDADPFYWILDKLILVFGGAYIPVALLPQYVQTIVSVSPFGAPMFATQMFNPGFGERWPFLFAVQMLWITVLFTIVSLLFAKARQNVSVNGG